MTERPFDNTGLSVAPLGFGSAPVGYLEKDETAAGEVINSLLDHGANVIDTAECYGCAEGMIGRTVGHRCNEYAAVVQRIRQAFGQSRENWPGLT